MLKRLVSAVGALLSLPAVDYNYHDDEMAFELPGQWHVEAEPSAWIALRNQQRNAQFVVGLVRVTEPMLSYEARLASVEKLALVRVEQMTQLSSNAIQISDPTVAQVGDQLLYDFMAKSLSPAVRIYVRLVQRKETIATFSLYEFGERSEDQFLQLVRTVFSSTILK